MRFGIGLLVICGVLAGCSNDSEKLRFDGQFYRTKLSGLEERHQFQVTAAPVQAQTLRARVGGGGGVKL